MVKLGDLVSKVELVMKCVRTEAVYVPRSTTAICRQLSNLNQQYPDVGFIFFIGRLQSICEHVAMISPEIWLQRLVHLHTYYER